MGKGRKRGGREAGQALILVTAAMPLLFSVIALVADGANLMAHKRQLQSAADAAALAVAQDLGRPCAPACLASVAGDYSSRNDGPATVPACASASDTNCYQTPYNGNASLVEVRLKKSVSTFFAGIIGISSANVSARAVASTNPLVSPPTVSTSTSLGTTVGDSTSVSTSTSTSTTTTGGAGAVAFAKSTGCTKDPSGAAITYSGAGGGSIGALIANGGMQIQGNSNNKTIDYLALGRNGESVAGVPCYDNPGVATLIHPPVRGPWSPPMDWPVAPPTVPTPPSGCTSLNPVFNITTRQRNNQGIASLTTSLAHNLVVGDSIVVAGVQDASFNGAFTVTAIVSATTFSYANPGPRVNSTSSGGTVTGQSAMIGSGWENTHPPGIYCLTGAAGTLTLQGVDLTGGDGYTFFAPRISLSGGQYKCYRLCTGTPGTAATLFDATIGNISMQGNAPSLIGNIYAPNGEVSFAGGGVSGGSGFIEAQTLKFTGNFASYAGTGPNVGATTTTTTTTTTFTTTTPGFTDPGTTTTITTPGATTGSTIGLGE